MYKVENFQQWDMALEALLVLGEAYISIYGLAPNFRQLLSFRMLISIMINFYAVIFQAFNGKKAGSKIKLVCLTESEI